MSVHSSFQLVKKPRRVSPLSGEMESYLFSEAITVAPADSRALFAPANRGAASKPPRLIRHRRRFGAFHVRAGKHFLWKIKKIAHAAAGLDLQR